MRKLLGYGKCCIQKSIITFKVYPFASPTLYLISLPVNRAHTHIVVASLCLTHITSVAPMEHHLVATVNLSFLLQSSSPIVLVLFLSNTTILLNLPSPHPDQWKFSPTCSAPSLCHQPIFTRHPDWQFQHTDLIMLPMIKISNCFLSV